MPKFLITMAGMDAAAIKAACTGVLAAAAGSGLSMDAAYVDQSDGHVTCVWEAPDRASVEALFSQAGQRPERIRAVTPYKPG